MASIFKKSEPAAPVKAPAPTMFREWDPLRVMRDMLRWDPFRPFQEMPPMAVPETSFGFAPTFDIKETKDNFLFKADVPGVKEEDLEVTLSGNRLMITGKREAEHEDKHDTWYAWERSYGSFTRSFTLPDSADFEHMTADLKEGVLTVFVPKLAESKQRKVPLGGAADKPKA